MEVVLGYQSGVHLLLYGNEYYNPDKILLEGIFISVMEKNSGIRISCKDVDTGDIFSFYLQEILNGLVDSEIAMEKDWNEFRILAGWNSAIKTEEFNDRRKLFEKRTKENRLQQRFFNQLLEYYYAYKGKKLVSFFEEGKETEKKKYKGTLTQLARELVERVKNKEYDSREQAIEIYCNRYLVKGESIKRGSLKTIVNDIWREAR